ncbi:MAG: hypothetical protein K2X77_34125 [Candidatus Obscuribacterales bacterium]|jgi:hypothetical protein|nr:hypothetical protein [Candidatus Obscuribacterales bacterium]
MSSPEEAAEIGTTISSACTSCGTPGHAHGSIEALSRLREDVYFALQDARKLEALRRELHGETTACNCEPTKS